MGDVNAMQIVEASPVLSSNSSYPSINNDVDVTRTSAASQASRPNFSVPNVMGHVNLMEISEASPVSTTHSSYLVMMNDADAARISSPLSASRPISPIPNVMEYPKLEEVLEAPLGLGPDLSVPDVMKNSNLGEVLEAFSALGLNLSVPDVVENQNLGEVLEASSASGSDLPVPDVMNDDIQLPMSDEFLASLTSAYLENGLEALDLPLDHANDFRSDHRHVGAAKVARWVEEAERRRGSAAAEDRLEKTVAEVRDELVAKEQKRVAAKERKNGGLEPLHWMGMTRLRKGYQVC